MFPFLIFLGTFLIYFPFNQDLKFPGLCGTKYLMYLPHSGMNNQRISLENALILSKLLNRTLIIPPLFIGKSSPKQSFYFLYFTIKTKIATIFKHNSDYIISDPIEDVVKWSSISNLNSVANEHNVSIMESVNYFGTPNQNVYYILNDLKCKYIITDYYIENPFNLNSNATTCKSNKISIDRLNRVGNKYLFFGSLFGSKRFGLKNNENVNLAHSISNKFALNKSNVYYENSKKIAELLIHFIGIHYRAEEHQFRSSSEYLMNQIITQLDEYKSIFLSHRNSNLPGMLYSTSFTIKDLLNGKYTWPRFYTSDDKDSGTENLNIYNRSSLLQECLMHSKEWAFAKSTKSPFLIYMATDVKDPLHHEGIMKLLNLYPCTFFQSDFNVELNNPRMMPIIDQYVVSMATAFIGYHVSTYSQFSAKMYLLNNNCDGKLNLLSLENNKYTKSLVYAELGNILKKQNMPAEENRAEKWFDGLDEDQQIGIYWKLFGCGHMKLI
eukprot:NODE_678_length_5296_cov_0.345776.p1 type:complete len:496 gc:universal NODE_678_length_5296_cov_0.345776:3969-2482(-)